MAEGEKRSISILKSLTRTAYAHKAIDAQQPGFQSMMVSLLLNRSPHDSMDTLGEGATPLHYAAKSGDAPMIKLLLASGADPRLKVKKSKLSAGTNWIQIRCRRARPASLTRADLIRSFIRQSTLQSRYASLTLPHSAPLCPTLPHSAPLCPTLPHSVTPACPLDRAP